jgi:peptidoglycan-associated lipoprotein
MKLNKIFYALALALITMLGATGCKHQPANVTMIPDNRPKFGEEGGSGTLNDPNGTHYAQGDLTSFDNMSPDRQALAAYTIYFSYDSAAIKKAEQTKLQSVASELSRDPSTKLTIEGNCDERGTEEYNRALGDRRANAAREALAKLGIDPMRVRTLSNGKDKPLEPSHDDSAWSKNRRDDFILLRPKTGA